MIELFKIITNSSHYMLHVLHMGSRGILNKFQHTYSKLEMLLGFFYPVQLVLTSLGIPVNIQENTGLFAEMNNRLS